MTVYFVGSLSEKNLNCISLILLSANLLELAAYQCTYKEYSQANAVALPQPIKQRSFLKNDHWYHYFNVLPSQGTEEIYGKATFAGLHSFHKLFKDNATNMPTELTNVNYGIIPLIISPTEW